MLTVRTHQALGRRHLSLEPCGTHGTQGLEKTYGTYRIDRPLFATTCLTYVLSFPGFCYVSTNKATAVSHLLPPSYFTHISLGVHGSHSFLDHLSPCASALSLVRDFPSLGRHAEERQRVGRPGKKRWDRRDLTHTAVE